MPARRPIYRPPPSLLPLHATSALLARLLVCIPRGTFAATRPACTLSQPRCRSNHGRCRSAARLCLPLLAHGQDGRRDGRIARHRSLCRLGVGSLLSLLLHTHTHSLSPPLSPSLNTLSPPPQPALSKLKPSLALASCRPAPRSSSSARATPKGAKLPARRSTPSPGSPPEPEPSRFRPTSPRPRALAVSPPRCASTPTASTSSSPTLEQAPQKTSTPSLIPRFLQ